MSLVSATLDVNVSIHRAYDRWIRFEEYPRFLPDVEAVERVDETHLRWRGRVAGVRRDWSARITEQRTDELVAWTSDGAVRSDGVVTFAPVAARRTRVTLWLDLGAGHQDDASVDGFGLVRNRALVGLERFREVVEGGPRVVAGGEPADVAEVTERIA